ncbi:5965_t:CDS:2, partial [Dentiscutata heterogama]
PSDTSADYDFTYPNIPNCEIGDVIKVFIGSQWLTSTNTRGKKAWGTDIYTSDSNLVMGKLKLDLSEAWPVYDIIVTLCFLPGQHNYTGSTRQRITTKSYGFWRLSYIIEDVETIPLNFAFIENYHLS